MHFSQLFQVKLILRCVVKCRILVCYFYFDPYLSTIKYWLDSQTQFGYQGQLAHSMGYLGTCMPVAKLMMETTMKSCSPQSVDKTSLRSPSGNRVGMTCSIP